MKNAHLNKWIMSSSFKAHLPIILAFFLLTLFKIFISTFFNSPWIFADETVYAETARNILHGEFFSKLLYCQTYPPGYSLFLSSAYLISDNPFVSYHFMLIINAILTSSIIFPAYFILKKYCPRNISIIGSIFIAILPAVILYNFVVLSENLFIPLFIFSLWFLIESFETNSKKWEILAGFSIFLLFFTRTPGIAMIIGFFFALIYYLLNEVKSKKITILIKENYYCIVAFGIPTIFWIIYKSYRGMAAVSGYNNDVYVSSIFKVVSNTQAFAQFFFLSLHELEFLIISSYFIFFILALYYIYELSYEHVYRHQSDCEHKKILSLESGIIYILISSTILFFITVTHMFNEVIIENNINYYIFGRYLDPVVPAIILIGIIGYYCVLRKQFFENKKFILILILINLLLIILFLADFPTKNYNFPNTFSIFYIYSIADYIPVSLFMILLVGIISVVFSFGMYYKKTWYFLFILLTLFTIFGLNYTITAQHWYSSNTEENNYPIVEYLVNHSNESTRILMSAEDYSSTYGIIPWYSTQFFIKGYLVQNSSELSLKNNQDSQRIDYTISQRILPFNVLAASKLGYKLYSPEPRRQIPIILPYAINVGSDAEEKIENFYSSENNRYRWTKNESKILIDYPKIFGDMILTVNINGIRPGDNPAHVVFKCNDQELKNVTFTGNSETVSLIVPENYLNENFQILEIDTNTWRPGDYGYSDSRDLGIQIDNIFVQNSTKTL